MARKKYISKKRRKMNKYNMEFVREYKELIKELLKEPLLNPVIRESLEDILEWLEGLEKQKTLFDF